MENRNLIKRLDTVFQKYIRLRDTGGSYGKCISCGKYVLYGTKECQAGHYFSRRHISIRWNEKNVNVQCCYCNTFNQGNQHGYRKGLIEKYGIKVLEELEICKSISGKYGDFEIEHLIKIYKQKIKLLT